MIKNKLLIEKEKMSSPALISTPQQPLGQTRSITDAFMKARALRRERNITVTVRETEGQELLSPDLEKGKKQTN